MPASNRPGQSESWEVDLRSHLPPPHRTVGRAEPAPPHLFRLELPADMPLPIAVSEVMLAEYDRAIDVLRSEPERPVAVHETRKSLKRLRALLRLIRDEIGRQAYRDENVVLRDAGRMISGARTASVMSELAPTVVALAGVPSAYPAVRRLLDDLVVDRDRHYRSLEMGSQRVVDVLTPIQWSRARAERWPVIDVVRSDHGTRRPIRDEFTALAPGLARVYRRGGRAMVGAYRSPSTASFHEWRKRVRYLRHHIEALHQAWPDVMRGLAASIALLGDILGEEHDHAELADLFSTNPTLAGQPDARRDLIAWIARQRHSLRNRALGLGGRIYHEAPDAFVARVGNAWTIARREAMGGGR